MRPERLAPSRARIDGAALERMFRLADGAIIAALAIAVCAVTTKGGVFGASLASILPEVLAGAAMIWGLRSAGAYRLSAREGLALHLGRSSVGLMLSLPVLAASLWLLRLPSLQTASALLWLGLSYSAILIAHGVWRLVVRRLRAAGRLTPNVFIVGATVNAERLIQELIRTREANVLGVFDDRLGRAPPSLCGVPVLGDTRALIEHRIAPFIDRIVVTVPPTAQGRVRQIIAKLSVLPNEIALFLDFDPQGGSGAGRALDQLGRWPLAQMSGSTRNASRTFWKRAQDLVLGSAILVAAAPVMGLIAIAIRLDSPGPVFFRQRRHGFNNEEIVVWKFRSMRAAATDHTASRQVSADDDRITRVGRFIRQTSLDELPQIFNVLKGEMSLVGPRPHAIGMKTGEVESARLVAEYAHRHRLKPGMTGWAAIKGSRGPVDTPESVRRRVELDVEYIERQSFWLDLYIMAVTAPCLLGDRSAVR
jgi:Undecaprenyl-phosphate glucose phosphotransferase